MMFIDYSVAEECENEETLYICFQCGMCGRRFEDGFMVDDGGTHILEDDHDDSYRDDYDYAYDDEVINCLLW